MKSYKIPSNHYKVLLIPSNDFPFNHHFAALFEAAPHMALRGSQVREGWHRSMRQDALGCPGGSSVHRGDPQNPMENPMESPL